MTLLKNHSGFTLVELIVAMAFFTFMMIFISVGVLQIMRIYQAGVASRRTQGAARFAIEEITREVRNGSQIRSADANQLCIDGTQNLEFAINSDNSLVKYQGGDCDGQGIETVLIDGNGLVQAREFLASAFNSGGIGVSARVSLTVTTGSDDLFDASKTRCLPGEGAQYCSATTYTNVVSLRGIQ